MVRCSRCGLLFASSIYDDELVEKLYENSDFTYDTEVKGLKQTYQNCLDKAHKYSKLVIYITYPVCTTAE